MRRAVWLLVRHAQGGALHVQQTGSATVLRAATAIQLQEKGAALSPWQARWSHCACPGDLSLPPPKKVVVEYAPAEVDTFIEFADAVEEEFEGVVVDGVEVDGSTDAFDVKLENGQLVFSRASETGSGSSSSSAGSSLPPYTDLFERLRQAGLQAAAA